MTEDTMIDKITKLLAKAERAGTPEEAEAFAAKATDLMMKHSIDEAMVANRKPGSSTKVAQLKIPVYGSYWQAHREIAFGVARAFDCKLLQGTTPYAGKQKGYALVVGFEDDLKLIEQLYASLLIQCQRGLDAFKRSGNLPSHYTPMEKFTARRSFIFGFADEVTRRLVEQRENAKASAQETNTGDTSVALVLANRKDAVDQYFAEAFPRTGKARGGSLNVNGSGLRAGRVAGSQADIGNRRVQGSNKALGR
jgi:hypothetical protein